MDGILETQFSSNAGVPQGGLPGGCIALWQRRRLVGKSSLIGGILGALLALCIPSQYQSTVRLMPPEQQAFSGGGSLAALAQSALPAAASGVASSLLGTKSPGATFVGILQSRTIADDLIRRFDLLDVYGARRLVDARRKLTSRTSIEEDRKNGIITLTVTDHDPVRARDLAGAYVEELDKLVLQVSTSSAHRERIFLESRLKSVKQELDAAVQELSLFSSRNATMDVESQGKATLEAAARLKGELVSAQGELRGLQQIYSDNNVRVRAAKARIGELESELRELSGSDRENGAPLGEDQLYPSLRKLPMLGSTYSDLYRRAKTQGAVFESLTKEYEFAKLQEVRDLPPVKIIDAPDIAEKKSFPPRTIIALAGGCLAFLLAIAWVLLEKRWHELDDGHSGKLLFAELARAMQGARGKEPAFVHDNP